MTARTFRGNRLIWGSSCVGMSFFWGSSCIGQDSSLTYGVNPARIARMLKSFLIASLLACAADAQVVRRVPKVEPQDTDLVIVFDTSGSMGDHVPGGRKLDIAKAAMWKFVDSLPKSVSVGLVTFTGHCGVRV